MSVGTIYKLHCNITGEDYYGSTKWYPNRISAHKCSTEKQLFKRQCKSRQILDRGNYTFSVLEECPIEELKPRERYYFENFPCINQIIPYKTREEILQYKRDRSKSEIGKQEKPFIVKNIDKNYQSKNARGIMRIKMKLIKDDTQDTYVYVDLKPVLIINRSTKNQRNI